MASALIVFDNKNIDFQKIKNVFSEVKLASLKKDVDADFTPSSDIFTAVDAFNFLKNIPNILTYDALIFDSSVLPKETASYFANAFSLSTVSHTKDFEVDDNIIAIVYSWENLGLKILSLTKPSVFVYDFEESKEKNFFEKQVINFETNPNIKLAKRQKNEKKDILDTKVAVGVGLGVSKDVLPKIKEFASLINAVVVGTRPASDLNYIEKDMFVGDTGIKIKTDLYIAFGISGAIQHMEGVQAKKIIAVNSDKNAPIFSYSQISINQKVEDVIDGLLQWAKNS